jgi:flagellar basal-body rod protein FlgC
MDYSSIFAISASGMDVQKARLEVAAHNLANAQTVRDVNGQPFHPLRVLSVPGAAASSEFTDMMDAQAQGASAVVVQDVTSSPHWVYEPGHPYADAKGMVAYPAVNHLEEMVTITQALRAYEANVAALQATRSMASHALDIGGNT